MFFAKLFSVVMFQKFMELFVNDVTKCVCVLIIYVCIKFSESLMMVFLGGLLCNSVYGCIFVYSVVQYCRHSGVT